MVISFTTMQCFVLSSHSYGASFEVACGTGERACAKYTSTPSLHTPPQSHMGIHNMMESL